MAASAAAQDDAARSIWECLPQETAVALRVANGAAMVEALRENTKLGAVLFNDERLARFREVVEEHDAEGGENLRAGLAEFGLTPEDLPQLLAGESGFAVLISEQRAAPMALGVGWLEPGADLAGRAYEAIARAVDEQQDAEHPPRRVDLEVAGQTVMQITVPVVTLEYGEFELPENYDSLPEEEQSRAWDEAYKKYEERAVEKVDFQVSLVAQLQGRVVVAHTFGGVPEDEHEAVGEELETVLARIIEAHSGEPGEFLPRVLATRGIDSTFEPQGIVCLEAVGDPAPLLKLARAQPDFQADEESEKVMGILGADTLGPFALRMVLDGQRLHTRFFLSAPEPRSGIVRLMDQAAIPPEVPAWVPATAISFSQFSFDLGNAYRVTKEEVTRQFPEEADQSFGMVEMQVQNFTQSSLEQILDSLGSRHTIVSFEPEVIRQDVGDGVELELPQDRMVLVWQVRDEEVWNRLIKSIGTFAAFAPGLEATDEQGYHGWRLRNEEMEGGLVLGNGYLVLAVGGDVLEMTLSSLNNPPSGADAFRQSELLSRGTSLMDAAPGIGFEVTDANRYAKLVHAMLRAAIQGGEAAVEDFEEAEGRGGFPGFAMMKALLPDQEEMENILGASISEVRVDENGLSARSVNEMPPPE